MRRLRQRALQDWGALGPDLAAYTSERCRLSGPDHLASALMRRLRQRALQDWGASGPDLAAYTSERCRPSGPDHLASGSLMLRLRHRALRDGPA
jgi:hypothetical protein